MSQATERETLYKKHKWKITGVGIGLAIELGYLILRGSRYSQLMGYFAYMSVACALIPLPTPPYVIALGKVFHPGIVAFVGVVANCLAALAEYHIIAWLFSKTATQGSLALFLQGSRQSHLNRFGWQPFSSDTTCQNIC